MEVYKANMTVASNCLRKKDYRGTLISLFRIDLFVFYGGTLFLQTFLFPFSLAGWVATKIKGDDGEEGVGNDKDVGGQLGSNGLSDALLQRSSFNSESKH
jgi:hypothetical protein